MSNEEGQEQLKTLKLKVELPKCLSIRTEIVEIETTLDETLPQLKETLGLIPKTENLTNFNIFYKDINLFECFSEVNSFGDVLEALGLSNIDTLLLKIVEKSYNLAAIYQHLLKFRQVIGLHLLDNTNDEFGVAGGVQKFTSLGLTEVNKPKEPKPEETTESDKDSQQEIELSSEDKALITNITEQLTSGNTIDIVSVGAFEKLYKDLKIPLKSLTISQWSPVPQFRKSKGDLLYLQLQTLEGEIFQITCHSSGFFVNKSSSANFNPAMKETVKSDKSFVLFDLVSSLSPLFEKTLIENNNNLSSGTKHPETYLLPSNSFVAYPWTVNPSALGKTADVSQSQLKLLDGGVDGGDSVRDWNEEFQSIKELPRTTINERILRDKLLNKTIHEFNRSATETAINIINGNITSLNISEDPQQLTYLRNGIFYSYGIDATGAFEVSGGDEAARYTAGKDVNTIKILNRLDSSEIHNLLTLVVDYMGKRIICQAPVPGIFQETRDINTNEVLDKVVYGLNSDNSAIVVNDSFEESWKAIAEAFHLKPHTVELPNGIKSEKKLAVSKDMKGLLGTDGRKYMIDTYRTVPLDINFIEKHYKEEDDTSYPHKETLLRHEAVEEWWRRKMAVLIKEETEKLESEGKVKENDEKPKILVESNQVSVNTDAFSGVNESKEDQQEVREISEFVYTLIEEFLADSSSQLVAFDGSHFAAQLHKSGINMRYLGYIAEQCVDLKQKELDQIQTKIKENLKLSEELAAKEKEAEDNKKEETKVEEKEEEDKEDKKEEPSAGVFEPVAANYETIYNHTVIEMISRAVKHILRQFARDLPINLMTSFVSHFMNCLLGSKVTETPLCLIDEDLKAFSELKHLKFISLNTKSVEQLVSQEVYRRFRFKLPENFLDHISPAHLLREVSIKFGIQWKASNYSFTKEQQAANKDQEVIIESEVVTKKGKKGKKQSTIVEKVVSRQTTFVPDDIICFTPLAKDSSFKPTLLDEISETAKIELSKEQKNGIMLYNELLGFYEQIFGRIHPETASYYGQLSQLYAELGMFYEASNLARVACIINERVHGLDNYNTITAYVNDAFFESNNNDLVNSTKLYQRAIDLWSSCYGYDHPSFITTFANLADNMANAKLYDASRKLFEKSIELSIKLNGEESEVTGLIKYRYAYSLVAANNYKIAREYFSDCHNIFKKVISPTDTFTVKSLNFTTNIGTYLEYEKHEKAKKLELLKQKAKVNVPVSNGQKPKNKKKGKSKTIEINKEIASKSVDDILAFIEGPSSKSKK